MRRAQGFTLIELVMVVILLGISSLFVSEFLRTGTQIYTDASSREQLMSDARFGIERLNREVRDAVPGTVTVDGNGGASCPAGWVCGRCLRFAPISSASRYNSLPTTTNSVMELTTPLAPMGTIQTGDYAIVYPIQLDATKSCTDKPIEPGKIPCSAAVRNASEVAGTTTITLDDADLNGKTFTPSPGNRVYFSRMSVQYCIEDGMLKRNEGNFGLTPNSPFVVMAENLATDSYFGIDPTSYSSGGEINVKLSFFKRDESIVFEHKIGVENVP